MPNRTQRTSRPATMAAMCREVTLVVVDADGVARGALPPYEVESPYWQSVSDVVDEARRTFGIEVTVLRILTADPGRTSGGPVSYLVQADPIPPRLTDVDITLTDDPLRMSYAKPGGPQAVLQWAADALDRPVTGVRQERTWNLSAVWELSTPTGSVWVKVVPPFFAHEGAVISWLTMQGYDAKVPTLLAHDGPRMLLDHIAGEDLWNAEAGVVADIAEVMHRMQLSSIGDLDGLVARGVPDQRGERLAATVDGVVRRYGADLDLDALPARLEAIAACGLPDTLVHGDLHTGNARGDNVILDWGDAIISHPGLDILRLTGRLDAATASTIIDSWAGHWLAAYPDSDPLRAVELLRPIEQLRLAAVYARFLDHIEPSEHVYHHADVRRHLDQAVVAWREEGRRLA